MCSFSETFDKYLHVGVCIQWRRQEQMQGAPHVYFHSSIEGQITPHASILINLNPGVPQPATLIRMIPGDFV